MIDKKDFEIVMHLHIWFKKLDKRAEFEISKVYSSLWDIFGRDSYKDENVEIWITGGLKYSEEETKKIIERESKIS